MIRIVLGLVAGVGLVVAAFDGDASGLRIAAAALLVVAVTGFLWYPQTAGTVLVITAMCGPVAIFVGAHEHGWGWMGSLAVITAAAWVGALVILLHHGSRPPRPPRRARS